MSASDATLVYRVEHFAPHGGLVSRVDRLDEPEGWPGAPAEVMHGDGSVTRYALGATTFDYPQYPEV